VQSPWTWFRSLFAQQRRGEDPQRFQRYYVPYLGAGLALTEQQTLELSTVWACVSIIASAIGSCRWNIYQPLGPRKKQLLYDDPLAWTLNTRPNPDMTAIGFREAMLMCGIAFGNSYAEIVRDGAGRVTQLWPLSYPHTVQLRRDEKTWALYYQVITPDGELVRLEQRDMFHLRGPGLHGLMGDNIVARAAKSLAVAAAQERYSASFFGQGANPGGVLTAPGTVSDPQHERLKKDWAEKKQGPENAHRPMILENGWKWEANEIDPQKSQLTEGRQFSVEDICRWFNVPPHKVQHLLHATFSNIEHQSIEFARDTCTPWARRLEQEADYKLFPQGRQPYRETCIDLEPLKEGDAKSRADAAAVWRQNGIKTANEIREREGLDSTGPDGDVLLANSTLKPMDQLLRPPAPPPLALPDPQAPVDDPQGTGEDPTAKLGDTAAIVARKAIIGMVGMALSRYSRRLASRRADLERRKLAPAALERNLAGDRQLLLPQLFAELVDVADPFAQVILGRSLSMEDLQQAALLVEAGHAPAAAAVKALPESCPRPG
jgi:HK97 family phage portal protein